MRTFCLSLAIFSLVSICQAEDQQRLFTVGVAIPLTGMAASYGEAFQQGMQLYGEEHPGQATTTRLIFEDHQYDGMKTVSAVRKLGQIDKVDFMVVWGVNPAGVAAPLAEQIKTPMLTVTSEPVAKGRSLVATFRLQITAFFKLTQQILAKYNIKRPGALCVNIGSILEFKDKLKDNGIKLYYDEIAPTDSADFRTLIVRMKQQNLDSLFLLIAPNQMETFARQAQEF